MNQYIIKYDPATGQVLDKHGAIWQLATNVPLEVYEGGSPQNNSSPCIESVRSLVDKGVSVEDIIKLKDAGLL